MGVNGYCAKTPWPRQLIKEKEFIWLMGPER